ncbi:DNA-binding protein [Cupriavidus basilensis]|uniref:DNA-binding protein n=1 Tax=Cupriavidus basilensis TaxID=68895 RepID=A0ABT6B126_9BURK|nr:DNA-binding protein [Cupriavidus basilensis]MDF3838473.1 DNA-binding protein [Cupriavidus basilensis]
MVQRLREVAASHGRSAEAEHRAILDAALRRPPKRSFAELLGRMPDVGRDEDFERPVDPQGKRPSHVFD